jgi:hypothetical protein
VDERVSDVNQIFDALAKMLTDDGYFTYGGLVWDALDSGQREVLRQLLFQGPVWDGNVPSKRARDDLIDYGLATRCCFLGEQGYTAATYLAFAVWQQGHGAPLPKKPGTPG